MSFKDKDLLEMYLKMEKETKMADRVANIARGNAGQTLVGNYFIHEVKKLGDDACLLTVGNKDSFFTPTKDNRKPDEHGAKYSNPTILFYKRKTMEVPTDFLRKGDYVRVFSKFVEGVEEVELDLKGLDAAQLQEVLKETHGVTVRDGKMVVKRLKNHYFGYEVEPINLTKETQDAIKAYRQTAKENKEREREIKDFFLNRPETGLETSHTDKSTTEVPNTVKEEQSQQKQPKPDVEESKQTTTDSNPDKKETPPTDNNGNAPSETVVFGQGLSFNWD